MRILQVVHAFPPFHRAGAEIAAHGLSRALAAKGHQVEVFHRIDDPDRPEYQVEEAQVDGLPVIRVNHTFRDCDRFERTYRNERIDEIFGNHLDARHPDLVHFHHVTCLSTNLVEEAHRRRIPVVFTLHDYWLICQRGQFLKRDLSVCPGQEDGACVKCLAWQLDLRGDRARVGQVLRRTVPALGSPAGAPWKRLLKRAYGLYAKVFFASQGDARRKVRARMDHIRDVCDKVDAFISPSRFLKERYVEFGVAEDRILHLTNGFDRSYYGRPRAKRDGIRFGYLGTWIPPKGLHVLIEAFNGIRDEGASLHIHGHALPYEGYEDYADHLRSLIRSPRIRLEGAYDNERVGDLLAELDVLVVPSIWYENSPMTIQEALLAGVPVITADLGGMSEMIQDGVNGLTFRPRDPEALRACMQRFLDDPELGSRLRPSGDGVSSIQESADRHLELYETVMARETDGALRHARSA
jgi:glycosyltransferase involved in cell wall biosynthesis